MNEAKFALPRGGEALLRMGTQIARAQEKAQELAVEVEIILWSLQPPNTSQIDAARRAISAAGGDPQKVTFLNGIQQLYNWLKAFTGS